MLSIPPPVSVKLVIAPDVEISPIPLLPSLLVSVNQSEWLGPAMMSPGEGSTLEAGNSLICPVVVIRPMAPNSLNHKAPSGPATTLAAPWPWDNVYLVICPAESIRH